MNYRVEIDGLRAFAIIPVLIFHAAPSLLPGGFTGVDVFFVISGYLITNILIEDLERGDYSIIRFYERRARRILPALIFMLLIILPAAWLLLSNEELDQFFASLSGTAGFYANFVFWGESGYFELDAQVKPLLHMWSLSVEEQYYLVTPLLIYYSWKVGEKFLTVVLFVLTLFSLGLSVYFSSRYPDASFFLIHTRFWELGIGALVAVYLKSNSHIPGIFSLFGFFLIAASFVFLNEELHYPGAYALLPTIGTALVIISVHNQKIVSGFLSVKVLQFAGLLSYSAYLWHQPLLVFARKLTLHDLPVFVAILVSLSSFIIAYFSWRYIESPFRNKAFLGRPQIFLLSIFSLVIMFVLGFTLQDSSLVKDRHTLSGLPSSFFDDFTKINHGIGKCDEIDRIKSPKCVSGGDPVAILWGDSYAMHLAQAIQNSQTKMGFVQATRSACAPIAGVAFQGGRYGLDWGQRCIKHNSAVLEFIERSDVDLVIMSSPFGQLFPQTALLLDNGDLASPNNGLGLEKFIETIVKIKSFGKTPIIVSPMPRPTFSISECITRAGYAGVPFEKCNFPPSSDSRTEIYKVLKSIEEMADVRVVYLKDFICNEIVCKVTIDEYPLYRDSSHLSRMGSAKLGQAHDFASKIIENSVVD